MDQQSFEKAKQYALDRLTWELSPGLSYHSLKHTLLEVIPAIETIAAGEGVRGEDLLLLYTAAWFHDLGFIEVRTGHEAVAAHLAKTVLPGFGYTADQIQLISNIIQATVIPQNPTTLLEKIMADADLDVLGRDIFWERNADLRQEFAFFGTILSDTIWYTDQLRFLETHTYHTPTARKLRDTGRQKNITLLKKALAEAEKIK